MLIKKATNENEKATDLKKDLMRKVDTRVDSIKNTNDEHLVVNFETKDKLEHAKMFENCRDEMKVLVFDRRKLLPKINICNVH